MTLTDLYDKLPIAFKPWVGQYGPVFLGWTTDAIKSWIDLLVRGRIYEAYAQLLKGLNDQAAVDEWAVLTAEWQAANQAQADQRNIAKAALAELLRVVLAIAMTVLGF